MLSPGSDTNLALIFKTVFSWVYAVKARHGAQKRGGHWVGSPHKENGPALHHFLSSRIHSPGKDVINLILDRMRTSVFKEKSHRQAIRPAENPGYKKTACTQNNSAPYNQYSPDTKLVEIQIIMRVIFKSMGERDYLIR